MCGIFFLIKFGSCVKLEKRNEILKYYRMNNSGIGAGEDVFIDLEEEINQNKIPVDFMEDIDFGFVYETLDERGPDYMKGFKIRLKIENEAENEMMENNQEEESLELLELEENLEFENSEEFEKFAKIEKVEDKEISIAIASSILRMRTVESKHMESQQPLIYKTDESNFFIFSYNGEIFQIDKERLNNIECENMKDVRNFLEQFDEKTHDTEFIFQAFQLIFDNYDIFDQGVWDAFKAMFSCLIGDFSFSVFFFQKGKFLVKFFKDQFGKRSLTMSKGSDFLIFSSVNTLKFEKLMNDQNLKNPEIELDVSELIPKDVNPDKQIKIKRSIISKFFDNYFKILKKNAIEVPGNSICSISLNSNSTHLQVENLDSRFNKLTFGKLKPSITPEMDYETSKIVLKGLLENSVENLLNNIPNLGEENIEEEMSDENKTDSKIAILFSGGLDSSLIALISALKTPETETIDLINISFSEKFDSFDRKIAIESYLELSKIFSKNQKKKFNFILVNKSYNTVEERENYIYRRIYPQTTHLDFNIGSVLHYASRSEGVLFEENTLIRSGARCFLDGLGADELFCGYRRYRTSFLRDGFLGMVKEMQFDLSRLWLRNLSRDDRAICCNGVEVRFPFLDYRIAEFIIGERVEEHLADFTMERGKGDKILLRDIAKGYGLVSAAEYPKKAMQFGSGIAKISNKKKFGSNRQAKGNSEFKLNNIAV